jgi:hypothetical protein
MAYCFAGMVLLLLAASIIQPDRKTSEEENRVLAGFPKFGLESIKNKDYMTGLESYASDQFVLRDAWISLKVQCDFLAGKREFNGVYLGKKKYLMQIPSEMDEKNTQENLEAINQFYKKNHDVLMNTLIVPNAAYIMKDYLPIGAPVRDQGADMEYIRKQLSGDIGCIDITDTLKQHAKEGIYYKTDHHWTTRGAAYGFNAAAKSMDIQGIVTEYKIYTVATDFSGTLASRSGYHKAEDTVEIYEPENVEIQYLVNDSDNDEKRPTLYDRTALDGKDKYQVFFGGNHAMVDISTTNDKGRRLLIFKDSYANCFVPFLLPYYTEIVMIDPRYYYDNVQTLMNNKGITDVLFLYNMDTFLTDNFLADVLEGE